MKTKVKKELKDSKDLIVGDEIEIGGLSCTVEKVEFVFHQMPKNRIRISLKIIGATSKRENVILFLPPGTSIETLK